MGLCDAHRLGSDRCAKCSTAGFCRDGVKLPLDYPHPWSKLGKARRDWYNSLPLSALRDNLLIEDEEDEENN